MPYHCPLIYEGKLLLFNTRNKAKSRLNSQFLKPHGLFVAMQGFEYCHTIYVQRHSFTVCHLCFNKNLQE
jgi:hypothetical protein